MKKWQEILSEALEEIKPVAAVCLFSGGYDSMISTSLAYQYWRENDIDISLHTTAIDTMLSADGWRGFVTMCAKVLNFDHFGIYSNLPGYQQFLDLVGHHGCPYSRQGHTNTYRRLKERGIEATLKSLKTNRRDRVLFITGVRRAESVARSDAEEYSQKGHSSAWFASPILYWSDEDSLKYRMEKDFPTNPFYETVGGSGDCQCNWGNFINLETLEEHAPETAAKVREIDQLSKEKHGWGWCDTPDWLALRKLKAGQMSLAAFAANDLCAGCERPKPNRRAAEELAMMREW